MIVKRRGERAHIERPALPEYKALFGDLSVEWIEVKGEWEAKKEWEERMEQYRKRR